MSQRAGTKVLLVVAVAEVVVVVVVVVDVAAVVLHVVDVEIRPVDHLFLVAVVGSARADSDGILEFFASALVVLMNVRKSHAEFTPGNEQQVWQLECKREREQCADNAPTEFAPAETAPAEFAPAEFAPAGFEVGSK